ncbi:hypothetical protein Poly24_32330 [Rosistilla carotiformis]|uniref:Methyltransferase FkbM domain-containing protein n=1 Tax=Rosistilla carotiformis TaxID=2528017 RepID=A0A518JVF1_9BACT|nr:FkbM family methyltransferase [Rosistilla carotiformis]QDV69517.1 hypothetical protein Poly24_32330 [Rosistilla carotiformis]
MSEIADLFDRLLRRNRWLPRAAWLRGRLRAPYHRLLSRGGRGLPLRIGGALHVRLPVDFCARELQCYEPETAAAIRDWVAKHPGGVFVDIGCSYGYFSCGVLFADPTARVLAIDADLPSLAIARHVCRFAPAVANRLQLFRTLIGEQGDTPPTVDALQRQTAAALGDPELKIDVKSTNYVNLDTEIGENQLPRISLDRFIAETLSDTSVPFMVKCDVEGAEQIVLEAAAETLETRKPTLLISVHPPYLPKFGGSVDAIRTLIQGHGYWIDVIGIDHEEHWLCQPKANA